MKVACCKLLLCWSLTKHFFPFCYNTLSEPLCDLIGSSCDIIQPLRDLIGLSCDIMQPLRDLIGLSCDIVQLCAI